MKVFDAKYATIHLEKEKRTLEIVWHSLVKIAQYKLVMELTMQLVRKHQILNILENQSQLELSNQKEIQNWLQQSFLPKINQEVEKYSILPGTDTAKSIQANDLMDMVQRAKMQCVIL
ncbi:MAG: hypothetical protein SFU27_14315 [Thermonemataceae bacterium]|nr:hypothetical protein [Thermonemataceae bacterium]